MRSIEKTGKTVDEAISSAISELNLPLSDVKVEVLENGNRGVTGISSTEAKVRVTEKVKSELGARAEKLLNDMLDKMEMKANLTMKENENNVRLEISNTPFGGILIGYRGETLNAIQYLMYQILIKETEAPFEIEVDVQDYRKRRQRMLTRMMNDAIEKVLSTGQPVELEPMNAYDRKFIHLKVKAQGNVTSTSYGEGSDRHIVILPNTTELTDLPKEESVSADTD